MGRGRTVAAILVLALLVGLVGACSSDGASRSKAQRQRAAHARAVAVRRTNRAHQRRAARQRIARRRAHAAAARHRVEQARLIRLRRSRTANPARDRAAIRRSVQRLNLAFHRGVVSGIARSTALNYWVVAGVYDAAACAAFEADGGDGAVSERLVLHPGTFRSTPGWVDPAVGRTPRGRLYAVDVDEIQTLVPTGARRRLEHTLHASVDRKGHAHLFFRCA